LHLWSDRLFNRGEYEPAIEKLEEAAERYRQTGNRNDLSRVYNSLGRLFRTHGQVTAALQTQLKALAIQESLDSPRNRLQSLNAVAVTYQSLGNARKARDYYERAIALAERIGAPNTLDFLRANFGDFLVESGDVERGRVQLEQSLPSASRAYRTTRLTQLSFAYRLLRRFDDALDAANRAIDSCHAGTPIDCVEAHLARANAELGLDVRADAVADVTEALGSLEQIHTTLAASDFLKQGFTQYWSSAYSVAIDLHARQRDWTAALETAELARARAFVDLLASRELAAHASRRRRVALSTEDEDEGPRSEASVAPTTVADLIAIAARRRATLLQYWSARDRLFVWVVSPDGTVRGAGVNVGRARIERLVRSIAPESASGPERDAAWKALYTALIAPIDRYLPRSAAARLIVVPHGPLLHVPFAALRDPRGRYLIERFTLSSVPSAATLRFTATHRHRDSRHGALLLVADPSPPPSIPGEPRLPRLPGALEETRAIARLVPASRTTLLAETVATRPRVMEAVRRPAVIHFATHAIVRDADPMSSFLALAAPHGGADGKLTAQQIYGLTLDADLVVLSACRSGAGLITGDGIASLARAFFYAGAPSVIVSVWDVADEPAERLLVAFYRSWLAGADKDRALRAAQLEFLRDLRAGKVTVHTPAGDVALIENPSVWAGFVLLGEPD
ncbi:MAG: CHAT domain-containing protein, partial [Vicinamibacterales bacterium]